MILETPWIGKDKKKQRPMYEAEIALLRGNVVEQFGERFLEDVEKLRSFFEERRISTAASSSLETWELLKNDAKARKADPREPMERLYDMVRAPSACRKS